MVHAMLLVSFLLGSELVDHCVLQACNLGELLWRMHHCTPEQSAQAVLAAVVQGRTAEAACALRR